MSTNISRDLAKMQPAQQNRPNAPSPAVGSEPVIAASDGRQSTDVSHQLKRNSSMKTRGSASLEHGNDFAGMPISGAEVRAPRGTSIPLGDVSGSVTIDTSRGNVFRMRATGNLVIAFDIGNEPAGYGATDWERSVTLRILTTGAFTITLPAGTWAPKSTAPVLNKQGKYEIEAAVNISTTMGNEWYFYPINQPA